MRLELGGQACQRDVIFGHHQQPGGALVQPVHNAWPQHVALEATGQLPLFAQPSTAILAFFIIGIILCSTIHTACVA